MIKMYPYLNFDGNAEEAFNFYKKVFGTEVSASIQALAQLIPPVLSGFIAAIFAPETPLIIASAILILAGVVFTLFYKAPKTVAHIKGY